MANDLNRDAVQLELDPQRLEQVVSAQAALRGLTEAMVFDRTGHVLARSSLSFTLGFQPIPDGVMRVADEGDVAIMTNDSDDRVRALVRLDQFGPVYLYVGRYIEPRVLSYMEETQRAVAQYQRTESQRSGFQITFALIFLMVAMLFLVAAVAIGIHFATQLAVPISRLATAAEQVRAGDLAARVPEGERDDELASLSRAFNRMTNQIESQQRELREANRQLDERRRFTETVLTGVSAGVIGLDRDGRVHLPNRSASALLGVDLEQSIGLDLANVAPEMAGLLDDAERRPDRLAQSQVQLVRRSSTRTLLVRIAAEHDDGDISGFVVTFDDITELLLGAAQGRLGRHRAPHRARNQEPADADPARRRAAAPPVPKGNQGGPRNLHDLHRHDHPPCRRHRPHGRRVLRLRPNAGAGAQARKPGRDRAARRVLAAHGRPRHRFRDDLSRATGHSQLRCAARRPGRLQHCQERNRSDRGATGRGQGGRARTHPGLGRRGGGPSDGDCRRQRQGAAAAKIASG